MHGGGARRQIELGDLGADLFAVGTRSEQQAAYVNMRLAQQNILATSGVSPDEAQGLVNTYLAAQDRAAFAPDPSDAEYSTDISWIDTAKQEVAAMEQNHPWLVEWQRIDEAIKSYKYGISTEDIVRPPVVVAAERAQQASTPAQQFVKQMGTLVHTNGEPTLLYSGTARAFDQPDMSKAVPDALFGPGYYMTTRPDVAGGDPLDVALGVNYRDPSTSVGVTGAGELIQPEIANPVGARRDLEGYAFNRYEGVQSELSDLKLRIEDNQTLLARLNDPNDSIQRQMTSPQMLRDNIEATVKELQEDQALVEQLSSAGPQVRAEYLIANRIFNAEQPVSGEDAVEIVNYLAAKHPGYSQNLETLKNGLMVQRKGEDLYRNLEGIPGTPTPEEFASGQVNISGFKVMKSSGAPIPLGRARINAALADLGYDAIKYAGGFRRNAGVEHDVYVVLNPRAVVSRFADLESLSRQAASMGVQLSKQGQIIESPALPEAALASEVTDAHVAQAALAAHPSSVVLVRGLTNPGEFVRDALAGKFDHAGVEAKYFRLVEREGRIDALVSPLRPITDEMAADYSKYGLFQGMRIISTGSGKEGIVESIYQKNNKTYVSWHKPGLAKVGTRRGKTAGVQTYPTLIENIAPMLDAPEVLDIPPLWEQFRSKMAVRLSQLSDEVGHEIEPLGETARRQMPLVFEETMDEAGISEPAVRAAIRAGFDQRLVDLYRGLAPELDELDAAVSAQLDGMDAAASVDEVVPIQQFAVMRGFTAVPMETGGGWYVEDMQSPRKFNFDSDDSARQFLMNFVREPLDFEQGGAVPVEVARNLPGDATPEPDRVSYAESVAEMERAVEELEASTGSTAPPVPLAVLVSGPGTGGGSGGGRVPPPPPSGPSGGGPPAPRGGPSTARMERLAEVSASLYHRYTSSLTSAFSFMRTLFADLETDLMNLGVEFVRPLDDYFQITQGMDKAHNEAYPLHYRAAKNINQFSSKHLYNGDTWRVFSEPAGAMRSRLAGRLKFSRGEMESIEDLEQMLRDWLGPDYAATRSDLMRFIYKTSAAQLRGTPNPYGDPAAYPRIQYFVEAMRDRAADFRYPNLGRIIHDFVATTTFNKHVGPQWSEITSRWNRLANWQDRFGQRPIAPLAGIFTDWMSAVRFGYVPGQDAALNAVQRMFSLVYPMTKKEASDLIHMGLNLNYSALLGWRIFPIVRDATQVLQSIPRVGTKALAQAMAELLTSSGKRDIIVERMAEAAALQRGVPPIEAGIQIGERLAEQGRIFSPGEEARRRIVQKVGLLLRDMTPPAFRTIEGTPLHPMYFYTQQNMWARVLVGRAAQIRANEAINNWQAKLRAAMERGDPAAMPTRQDLFREMHADSFAPANIRRYLDRLSTGDWKGFTDAYVNDVVNDVMQRAGIGEVPPAWRSHGGKLGWSLGGYTAQTFMALRNAMKYGSVPFKARVLLGVSAGLGGLMLAKRETGWNWMKYYPWSPYFAGGPAVEKFTDMLATVRGMFAIAQGREPDPVASVAHEQFLDVKDWIKLFNPAAGAIETVNEINEFQMAPSPLEAAGEYFFTGGKSSGGTQMQRGFERGFEELLRQQLQGAGGAMD
jgi:hypothetical protein